MKTNSYLRFLSILLIAWLVSACSIFESDGDEEDVGPAELVDFTEEVNIKTLWRRGIVSGQGGFNRVQMLKSQNVIYVAGHEGDVAAVAADSGKVIWSENYELPVAGGIGAGVDKIYVGTTDGDVVALSATNGELLWKVSVQGEVLSAPQGNGKVVAVQSYDGKLHGLNPKDGSSLWTFDSNVPVLTLRGTSSPIFYGDTVLAGFANGKVAAFDGESGTLRWETRIAVSQGRSEIERIVDIDGTLKLVANILYVVTYQGKLAAVDVNTGRRLWQQDASSYVGVDQGFGNIYVSDQQGSLMAYYKSGQGLRWEQAQLGRRGLNRPSVLRSWVAVADIEGYVHFISQVDGHFVGRIRLDSDGVRADMQSDGNVLYVLTNNGELHALSVTTKNK